MMPGILKLPTVMQVREIVERYQPITFKEILSYLGIEWSRKGSVGSVRTMIQREVSLGHFIREDGRLSMGYIPDRSNQSRLKDVAVYLDAHSPATLREICDAISCTQGVVRRHLKTLESNGRAESVTDMQGRAVLWYARR